MLALDMVSGGGGMGSWRGFGRRRWRNGAYLSELGLLSTVKDISYDDVAGDDIGLGERCFQSRPPFLGG